MLSKRISTMLLGGAAAAGMASAAQASFLFDVRAVSATGTGNAVLTDKSVQVTGPGTITFNLFGIINETTPDSNANNEFFVSMTGSFLSTGTSVKGNMTATVTPAYFSTASPPTSSVGTIQDLDGDGDLDVGGGNSSLGSDYWWARPDSAIPGQTHMLGTLTMTITEANLADLTATEVNYRKKLGAPSGIGQWRENGVNVISNANNIQPGTPVLLNTDVPEPTSIGLIGLAGLGMLARRRK